jgi:hypothetical protein
VAQGAATFLAGTGGQNSEIHQDQQPLPKGSPPPRYGGADSANTRDTSVSWNLMIGKNPLFVSRQHGLSVTTMWRTYAAWMQGALESDIALIQTAMNRDEQLLNGCPTCGSTWP